MSARRYLLVLFASLAVTVCDKMIHTKTRFPNGSVFIRVTGATLTGVYGEEKAEDDVACARACDRDEHCEMFQYEISSELCYLSSSYTKQDSEELVDVHRNVFWKLRGRSGRFTDYLPKEEKPCVELDFFEELLKKNVSRWMKEDQANATASTNSTTVVKGTTCNDTTTAATVQESPLTSSAPSGNYSTASTVAPITSTTASDELAETTTALQSLISALSSLYTTLTTASSVYDASTSTATPTEALDETSSTLDTPISSPSYIAHTASTVSLFSLFSKKFTTASTVTEPTAATTEGLDVMSSIMESHVSSPSTPSGDSPTSSTVTEPTATTTSTGGPAENSTLDATLASVISPSVSPSTIEVIEPSITTVATEVTVAEETGETQIPTGEGASDTTEVTVTEPTNPERSTLISEPSTAVSSTLSMQTETDSSIPVSSPSTAGDGLITTSVSLPSSPSSTTTLSTTSGGVPRTFGQLSSHCGVITLGSPNESWLAFREWKEKIERDDKIDVIVETEDEKEEAEKALVRCRIYDIQEFELMDRTHRLRSAPVDPKKKRLLGKVMELYNYVTPDELSQVRKKSRFCLTRSYVKEAPVVTRPQEKEHARLAAEMEKQENVHWDRVYEDDDFIVTMRKEGNGRLAEELFHPAPSHPEGPHTKSRNPRKDVGNLSSHFWNNEHRYGFIGPRLAEQCVTFGPLESRHHLREFFKEVEERKWRCLLDELAEENIRQERPRQPTRQDVRGRDTCIAVFHEAARYVP